jgi:hypothetical protein
VWGSPAELREAFDLAVWVAHVLRALNIDHGADGASPALVADGHREMVTLLRAWEAQASDFR